MKSSSLSRRVAAGLAIGLAASPGWSLTVGRAQGVALIGRPLEVTVPLVLDAPGDGAAQCTQAEIYYGDSRVDPSRVTADVQGGASSASVRVRSAVAVNEPVVTLYLHVGCGSKVTRRFVLLSEQPDAMADAARVPPAAPAAAVRRNTAERPVARAGTDATDSIVLGSVPFSLAPAAATAAPRRAASARAGAVVQGPAAVRTPARLKLEPLDLSAERDPTLRLSNQLAAPEAGSPERRAQAQALWRALTARPEDLLREAQRIEALDRELGGLRQSLQRNDAAVAGLRTELAAARSERYANPLVYALLALLLVSLAAALFAWRRGRWNATQGGDWWRTRDDVESDLFSLPPSTGRSRPAASSQDAYLASEPADLDLHVPVAPVPVPRPHEVAPAKSADDFRMSARHDDFRQSESASMRSVRAEELHDVQQEADFFVSLGDFDRAIEVLRNHISLNPGTSAVAWLDLLDIHHKLGQREHYESVRGEFLRNFNVQVPGFDGYSEGQAGLEQYGNAMDRIMALWPSRKVLELIEESIFRKPGQGGAEAFNLEAYRDLLLLHQIGRDLRQAVFSDSANATRSGFANTAIHPLSAQAAAGAAPEMELPASGALSSSVELDVNLDEPLPGTSAGAIGHAVAAAPSNAHLMDFDLPDIDTTNMRAKKTRE
jgi:hypothetical protein